MNKYYRKVRVVSLIILLTFSAAITQSAMAKESTTLDSKKDIWRPQNFTSRAEIEGMGQFTYYDDYYVQQIQPMDCYEFQNFICIEETFLGKPVESIYYAGRLDATSRYLSPRKGIYVSDNVKFMDSAMFHRNEFYNIHLSENLDEIPEYTCSENKNLKRVYIPAKAKVIKRGAFEKCDSLDKVEIASGVKIIEKEAFASCKKLKKLHIPDSVTEIAKDAFADSKNLVLYCTKDSYAYRYAKKNKIPVSLLQPNHTYQTQKLSVEETSIEVGTNEIYLLFPMLEPFYASNRILAFASSNPLVATVNQGGKVTGVKTGKAVITILTTDGSKQSIQIPVTVKQGKSRLNPYVNTFRYKRGRSVGALDTFLINRNPKAVYTFGGSTSIDFIVDGDRMKVKAYDAGEETVGVVEEYKGVRRSLGNFTAQITPTEVRSFKKSLALGDNIIDRDEFPGVKDGYGLTYQIISGDTSMLTIQDNGGDTITFTGLKAGTVKVRIIETYAGISMGIAERAIKIK